MKRNLVKRAVSMLLMLVLLLTMLPAAALEANAHYEIPIYWTEELYERDGYSGYIFELENVQKDCCGFTLGYCITDVDKGSLKGDFNIEVCVHDTSGNWFVAEMFTYDTEGEQIQEVVSWDEPRDIDKFTLILRKKGLSVYHSVSISNPLAESYGWQMRIPSYISDEKFTKSGSSTHPYVLEETLYGCQGFTLHFEIDQIDKGALTSSTKYEVYVCSESGTWKKVDTFTMRGDEACVDVAWDKKIDVSEIAVLCRHSKEFSYLANAAFSDAIYEPASYEDEYDYSDDEVNMDGEYLSGYWSDSLFKRSGRQSNPFVLDTPLKKCTGFTLDYEVTGVTEGNMKDNCKFVVYYCNSKGTWTKGKEFTLEDDFASVDVKLKKAATVTQVAVHCMNAGYFSYQYSLGVRDPIY